MKLNDEMQCFGNRTGPIDSTGLTGNQSVERCSLKEISNCYKTIMNRQKTGENRLNP